MAQDHPAQDNPARGNPVQGNLAQGNPLLDNGAPVRDNAGRVPQDRTTRPGQQAAVKHAGNRRVGTPRVQRMRLRASRGKVAAGVLVAVVVATGAAGGFSPAPSAEPTVQAFLLAWQSGHYRQAAAMTTGQRGQVARSLAAIYQQLGATGRSLHLGPIDQDGGAAAATFSSSMTLGRGGLPWTYSGRFTLVRSGPGWKVQWSPSVVVPGLRAGQRLAVRVKMPARAQLLDAGGSPLTLPSAVFLVGVRPRALASPRATAAALSAIIGVGRADLLGQMEAAPDGAFLELDRLTPADYRQLAVRLRMVPGLIVRRTMMRLFRSVVPSITGSIGTETVRAGDQPYRPGSTTGLSGLQRAFQQRLTGSATTQVVVDGADGRQIRVLHSWPGRASAPVRTTIDAGVQRAANQVTTSQRRSAAIIAVRAGSGSILAVSAHTGRGLPSLQPMSGQYRPGQAYTIVSAAALLGTGFKISTPIPCDATTTVGQRVFANDPAEPGLGGQPTFRTDFAHACDTAFVGLYLQLHPAELARTAADFGIGSGWELPLPAFSGAMPAPSGNAGLAADTIGDGGVRVSPLAMALAAGEIDSGSWHPPSLVTDPAGSGLKSRAGLSPQVLAELRTLMRDSVTRGAGRAAAASSPVCGQVGTSAMSWQGKRVRLSWFVGYRGTVAYAVLVAGGGHSELAARLAGQFARQLRPHA
jgi:cell division protein FtsI/penicillin-binding protein 2